MRYVILLRCGEVLVECRVENGELNSDYWNQKIASSIYVNYVFGALVPTMTSNTEPGGIVTASSYHETYGGYPYQAFDKNERSRWMTAQTLTTDQWICYEFPKEVVIYKADMLPRTDSTVEDPKDYKYQYSNDGNTWYDATEILTASVATKHIVTFKSPVKTKYIRLFAINNYGGLRIDILEIQYYGK